MQGLLELFYLGTKSIVRCEKNQNKCLIRYYYLLKWETENFTNLNNTKKWFFVNK